jgi:hypothetical protein
VRLFSDRALLLEAGHIIGEGTPEHVVSSYLSASVS